MALAPSQPGLPHKVLEVDNTGRGLCVALKLFEEGQDNNLDNTNNTNNIIVFYLFFWERANVLSKFKAFKTSNLCKYLNY